jgi:hypothetical protein
MGGCTSPCLVCHFACCGNPKRENGENTARRGTFEERHTCRCKGLNEACMEMKGASGLLASIYILHGWMDSVTCSFVLSRSVTSSLGLAGHCGRGRKLFLSCSRLLRCFVRACSLAFCVPAVSLIISRLDRSHSRVQYRCC